MSAQQLSIKWTDLALCPSSSFNRINIPTGADRNNYIVIHRELNFIHMHKYNIETDKWIKMGFNNRRNIKTFTSALHVKKDILYLLHRNSVTQIQLNNNHISNDNHNKEINRVSTSKIIIINDSLFIIGGQLNNSILKWNLENQTLLK
eukprot:17103_1